MNELLSTQEEDDVSHALLVAIKSNRQKTNIPSKKQMTRAEALKLLDEETKRWLAVREKVDQLQNKLNAYMHEYNQVDNLQEFQFVQQELIKYMLDNKKIVPERISNFVQSLFPFDCNIKLDLHGLACYSCTYYGDRVCMKEECLGPLKVTEEMKQLVEDIFGDVNEELIDKNFQQKFCQPYEQQQRKSKKSEKGKKSSIEESNTKTNEQHKKGMRPFLEFHYNDNEVGDDFDTVKMQEITFEEFLEKTEILDFFRLKSSDLKLIIFKFGEGRKYIGSSFLKKKILDTLPDNGKSEKYHFHITTNLMNDGTNATTTN